MELDNQPTENHERAREYPRGRYNLLLAVLVVILVIIGAAQFTGTRAVEPSGVSEGVLQGDISAKAAYFYSRYFPTQKNQTAQFYTLAIRRYNEAARENPSPAIYRRLIIVSGEAGRKDTAKYIKDLGKLKVPKAERAGLAGESAMWRAIYLGKPSHAEAGAYAARIRRLDLGWFGHAALGDLYARAGMKQQAQATQNAAQSSAAESLISLTVLGIVMVGLGLVGAGLLIWYAGKRPRGQGSADLPSASTDPIVRSNVAGYLLEAFVGYMWAIIVVQLGAGAFLDTVNITLSPMGEVIVTVAVYVLSGLLALGFLAGRLQKAGYSFADIGLRSRQPLADVLAGIGAYAAALPLVLVTAFILQWISRFVQSPENPIIPLFVESESWAAKVALFLLAVVAAPFFEELFFRGVLFSSFRAKWGLVAGVLISAVVFGLVHPLPMGLLPILVLGAVFAVVFNERGSLLPNMVAHALNNAVAFILLFILTG